MSAKHIISGHEAGQAAMPRPLWHATRSARYAMICQHVANQACAKATK